MAERLGKTCGPLVSVLISTYNRPMYVREALESILRQTYGNFEILLVRDGGMPVKDIVSQFDDRRLTFIDRDVNRGLPYSFNEAMSRAKGKYICYLGDDDIFYPEHIEVLVNAIEGQDKYGVVYSDLYKAHCRVMKDGRRVVLSKNVEVSRDFDRMVMLQFNHALHVAVMHRRDLLERAGGYNEKLNVLIDWDLTRKLSFYTDFKHVPLVTGEYYAPVGDCDRISVQRRKNVKDYIWNLLTIRSTRPPKPWSRVGDLSLILLTPHLDETAKQALLDIWSHTFYPYQIYLPLEQRELDRLETIVPNILGVAVRQNASPEEKVDAVLECVEGDYVAVVPADFKIVSRSGKDTDSVAWLEKSLQPLIDGHDPLEAFELIGSSQRSWAAVFRREQLERARRQYRHLPVRESAIAAGIRLRQPRMEEFPFQFDNLLSAAEMVEREGDWFKASQIYEYIHENHDNELWMKTRGANALYHAGRYDRAVEMAGELNATRPTVATLLIEGRAQSRRKEFKTAIKLLQKAEDILEGRQLSVWTQ